MKIYLLWTGKVNARTTQWVEFPVSREIMGIFVKTPQRVEKSLGEIVTSKAECLYSLPLWVWNRLYVPVDINTAKYYQVTFRTENKTNRPIQLEVYVVEK